MRMESPETWRLLWALAGALFLGAEMARRLRLWFLPLAVGAAAALGAAWLGLSVPLEWVVFAAVSALTLVLLRPLARRLSVLTPLAKIGSSRWIGREALVEMAIPAVGQGWVRLGRERWRAETGLGLSAGAIPVGSTVLVTGVTGTRLIVLPLSPVDSLGRVGPLAGELYQPTNGPRPDQGA